MFSERDFQLLFTIWFVQAIILFSIIGGSAWGICRWFGWHPLTYIGKAIGL